MTALASVARRHRKLAGLTQVELANLAGVGKTVVLDLEKGKVTIRVETMLKILSVLNIGLEPSPPDGRTPHA
ncbi:MAG: transcriptional regulator [Verrucomicrobia bacterium]|nr:MAG: transcriptional regulator [Verrucomicrobiota bacterium]